MQSVDLQNYNFNYELKRFSNKASCASNPQSRSKSIIVSFNGDFQATDYHYIRNQNIDSQKQLYSEVIRYMSQRMISIKNVVFFPLYVNSNEKIIPKRQIIDNSSLQIVGFAFFFKKDLRQLFNVVKIGKPYLEKAFKLLECEVENYNKFLIDDIWLIVVPRPHGKNFLVYGRENINSRLKEINSIITTG